jgi:predicted AAA+ superfamily ATPase
MLLQHIKLTDQQNDSLYVMADDLYFSNHRLIDLAWKFYQIGGKYLYIDEIHKYKGWSTEIKNIYDQLPTLQVIYTGSSILDLNKGGGDLSRRKVEYRMPGLSFREYLNMRMGWNLPVYTLADILQGKVTLPPDARPLALFNDYMRKGYYPFFKEPGYTIRLRSVVQRMVEEDIPTYAEMNTTSASKLKKLLYILAQSVPFKPNYSKLERDLNISRNTLPSYIEYLEKSELINLLREKADGIKLLEKVEKVYLNNPNISYALSETTPNEGTLRETIFFAWMRVSEFITSSKVSDFTVGDYTFEVGGRRKGQRQISSVAPGFGFIVKDEIEYAYENQIPLWMFGFIY